MRNTILSRTEKIEQLRQLLQENRAIYLTAFFSCGKTTLLAQLSEQDPRLKLRYDAAKDEWESVEQVVQMAGDEYLLLADNLERLDDGAAGKRIAAFLERLPEGCGAVLAGRAKAPDCLHALIANGTVRVLGRDFVAFDEEEIRRFYQMQGISLLPDDVHYLREAGLGWPLVLQITANMLHADPKREVMSLREDVEAEAKKIFMRSVLPYFTEQERAVLLGLAPFPSFSGDMARMVTGRIDAPCVLDGIAAQSYVISFSLPDTYSFMPFVRTALYREMKNRCSREYIHNQYSRAALYYELRNEIPQSVAYYAKCGNMEKIRELLIRDTQKRPANGDYTELKSAYALLSEQTILESPELMKGKCLIESLAGRSAESDRWYRELADFARRTPRRDARHRAAEEALRYLDIGLAQRGTANILRTLITTARLPVLTGSESWREGFNIAGNSVSLLNGGKDFSRWVPKGRRIYEKFRVPVEKAIGRGGHGLADLAVGECMFESGLTGDYAQAMEKVCLGLSHTAEDLELRCAGLGIQSRILAAQGNLPEARNIIENLLSSLPEEAPKRLRQNLTVYLLTLALYAGETQRARSWMDSAAPDETGDFTILDRYRYMLKLRLWIMAGQWNKTTLLIAMLRQYFEEYDRPYLRIRLHLLQAVIYRRSGSGDWRAEISAALALARRYRLVRAIADEGMAVVEMLNDCETASETASDPWKQGVMELTRAQAAKYPDYLKQFAERPLFSEREEQVYRLMAAGYSNARIGAILNVKERTVKFHTAEIYKKLGVDTRSEALKRAAELGDMK